MLSNLQVPLSEIVPNQEWQAILIATNLTSLITVPKMLLDHPVATPKIEIRQHEEIMARHEPFDSSKLTTAERKTEFAQDRQRSPWGIPYDDGRPREPTTYHQIGTVEAEANPGRFAAETDGKVVGAGAKYPAACGPWADPVAASLNSAPDPLGYEIDAQAPLGEPGEIERAAQILEERRADAVISAATRLENKSRTILPVGDVLAELDDAALQHEFARVSREQMKHFEGATLDRLEERRLAIAAEMERRRG